MDVNPFALNLRHLRAVLAAHELGSITAAAEAINLSQPALTQGLAKLEAQFGYTLFERRSGGMVATPMGEIVIGRARAAFAHLASGVEGLPTSFSHPERLMTMRQLRAFVALADAGSFAGAARASGMSQTAVHRAIGDLELIVRSQLVERRGRVIWLNEAGKKLARGARLTISEIVSAIADVNRDSSGSELIAIGALPTSRPYLVPAAMADLVQDGRAAFRVLEGSWRELVEPLRNGEIDIVVGALRPYEIADLYQLPLFEDLLVIVAGHQHPLVGLSAPTTEQLASFPWIVPHPTSPLRAHWEQLFAGGTGPAAPIVECGSVMIIGRLLTEGNFLTLLSPDQVALQIRSGLLAQIGAPLEHSRRRVGITTRRSWRPTAIQRQFLDRLKETADVVVSNRSRSGLRALGWI